MNAVVGMRQPITAPPDGTKGTRTAGIGLHQGFVPLVINYAGVRTGVITET